MKMKRIATLLSLAAAVSLSVSGRAMADYSYSTNLLITSVNGVPVSPAPPNSVTVGGTTVTLLPVNRGGFTVPSTNTLNIGDIMVTTTTLQPAGDTFTVGYTDALTLVNNGNPGIPATGTFFLTGTLTFSGINTLSGTITNVYNAPTSAQGPLGGVTFAGAVTNFTGPTVNGGNGNFGGTITSNAVPEPVSVLMLGMGLGGIGLVRFRKRKNRSTQV